MLRPDAENDGLLGFSLALCRKRQLCAVGKCRGISAERCRNEIHLGASEEARDERLGRALEQVERRTQLLDAAIAQQHDAVRQCHGLDLVVGHIDHGPPKLLVQPLDLDPHLVAQLRVEIAQAARRTGTGARRAQWRARWQPAGAGRRIIRAAGASARAPMPSMSAALVDTLVDFGGGEISAPAGRRRYSRNTFM